MLHLRGDGVTQGQLAEVAESLGIPTPVSGYCGHEVVILGDLDEGALRRSLCRPTIACLEWKDGPGAVAAPLAELERSDGIYLSLTTGSAFAVQPAQAFRQAVETRYDLAEETSEAVEIALNEGIANAVIHGNLDMGGVPRQTADEMDSFCSVLNERLADPIRGRRRVHVWVIPAPTKLTFRIEDEGAGYRPAPASSDPARTSGRGLVLIRSLARRTWLEREGRRLAMEFRR